MKIDLTQVLKSLKADPSSKHASQVLTRLAKNGTFDREIYQYQNHRFTTKNDVIDALQYFANHENADRARDDIRESSRLDDKYSDETWIDCNHLTAVTAEQVRSLIVNGLMKD